MVNCLSAPFVLAVLVTAVGQVDPLLCQYPPAVVVEVAVTCLPFPDVSFHIGAVEFPLLVKLSAEYRANKLVITGKSSPVLKLTQAPSTLPWNFLVVEL